MMNQPAISNKINAAQRGCIFGIAGRLGLFERGNPDDDLHLLVYRETGKHSISELSHADAENVISALGVLMDQEADKKSAPTKASTHRHEERAGGITDAQQRKVWQLMYQLRDLDSTPSTASLGDRLCGIIRKQLKVDGTMEQPFRFVTMQGGWKLIESIKKYIDNAKKKIG